MWQPPPAPSPPGPTTDPTATAKTQRGGLGLTALQKSSTCSSVSVGAQSYVVRRSMIIECGRFSQGYAAHPPLTTGGANRECSSLLAQEASRGRTAD